MSQDISNVQLLLILAGFISATSAMHHRKDDEELKFSLMTGYWNTLTVYGRIESLFGMVLVVLAIYV